MNRTLHSSRDKRFCDFGGFAVRFKTEGVHRAPCTFLIKLPESQELTLRNFSEAKEDIFEEVLGNGKTSKQRTQYRKLSATIWNTTKPYQVPLPLVSDPTHSTILPDPHLIQEIPRRGLTWNERITTLLARQPHHRKWSTSRCKQIVLRTQGAKQRHTFHLNSTWLNNYEEPRKTKQFKVWNVIISA